MGNECVLWAGNLVETMVEMIEAFDRCIRCDPARRGLVGSDEEEWCRQHLMAAADHLARRGRNVWILTGFYVPRGLPAAAETDGPPGAAFLASALRACGVGVQILTDRFCHSAVSCAAELYGLPQDCVWSCPDEPGEIAGFCRNLLGLETTELTHVISVERVGPAHTPHSWSRPEQSQSFTSAVSPDHWNSCHNMRAEIIDDVTPPLHLVMEWVAACCPAVKTIGIGDGGNEIGMGSVPYAEIRGRLTEPAASIIPCRIATDWTIVAGVSNWGAVALAAAACWFRGAASVLKIHTRELEERRLQRLVLEGPAVDGVTRLQQATVDGLPFLTYLQPWETMRQLLGLDV